MTTCVSQMFGFNWVLYEMSYLYHIDIYDLHGCLMIGSRFDGQILKYHLFIHAQGVYVHTTCASTIHVWANVISSFYHVVVE